MRASNSRTLHVAATLIVGCIFFPGLVHAQSVGNARSAERLEEQAAAMEGTVARWGHLSALLEKAAALRPATDRQATWDLTRAGQVHYYRGELSEARFVFDGVTQRALAMGDIQTAADGLINAAYVSLAQKDRVQAAGYFARARLLASSPLLSDSEREDIAHRAGVNPQVAARQQ